MLGNPVARTIVIHDCHPFVFTPVVWGTSPLLWTVPMRELRLQAGRGPSHRAASTATCPLHPAPAVCVRRSDGAAEENQDSDVPRYDARHGSPPRVRSNFHLLKFTIMPSTLQKPNRFSALERSAKNHSEVEAGRYFRTLLLGMEEHRWDGDGLYACGRTFSPFFARGRALLWNCREALS